MLFATSTFAIFFAVVWGAHWATARWPRVQLALLLAASWFFYAFWDWRFLGLLLGSTVVDFVCARAMRSPRDAARKRALWASLLFNLGVLATFKYFNFFADAAVQALQAMGWRADPFTIDVILPVGISFYTFQTLGYTIDVYRRRIEATDDALAFATYVAFFPQLVAGPIERAERLLGQLRAAKTWVTRDQVDGAARVCLGLFEKVVIADNLGRLADRIFEAPSDEVGLAELGVGAVAFAFQIWGDFAGYSDIAIGSAKMLGVELSENFDAPYLARSPREFWRRWHISLSTWLRDYLYIPLGGNRRGPVRTQINLALTMLLGGLWHGAAWTFVLWGAWHGLWLALHRAWVRARTALGVEPERWAPASVRRGAYDLLAGTVTFAGVCVAWVLFRATSLEHAGRMLTPSALVARPDHLAATAMYLAHYVWAAMVIQALVRARPQLRQGGRWQPPLLLLASWGLLFMFLHGGFESGRQFIYFQF